MGQDYLARKSAKKRAKKLNRDGAADFTTKVENGKKREKRTTPKKRLGVCFGQPVITHEDKRWSDDEGDLNPADFDVLAGAGIEDAETVLPGESNRSKRLKRTVHIEKKGQFLKPTRADPGDAKAKRRDARKLAAADAAAGKVKLSTTVDLLSAAALDEDAAAAVGAMAPAKKRKVKDEVDGSAGRGTAVVAEGLQDVHPVARQYLASQQFVEQTEVQRVVWEAACGRRDVVAQAPPGSGKTLAFLLPLAAQLVDAGHGRHTSPEGPTVLLMAPTRELALQTFAATRPLAHLFGLRAVCLYGGVDKAEQVEVLSRKPHIVVATPGRLLDLVDDKALSLAHVQAVTLDECDKMLSLGFAPQLGRLRGLLLTPPADAVAAANRRAALSAAVSDTKREKRTRDDALLVPAAAAVAFARPQVLLFTATMPEAMAEQAARWAGPDALHAEVGTSAAAISRTITQVVQVCAEHKKPAKLLKHLEKIRAAAAGARAPPRILVFANRVKTVKTLAKELADASFKTASLHGEHGQVERDAAVRDFKAGKVHVLVATDVAARGLHVRNLPYIVNFDFPGNLETYIHRVGRTGRLQAHGHAFSFFTRNLVRLAPALVALLREHGQALDPNLLRLQQAYQVIVDKLGPEEAAKVLKKDAGKEGGEGGGEDATAAALMADDLAEGLATLQGLMGARQGKRKRGVAPGRDANTSLDTKGLLPSATQAQTPEFVPCKSFTGKRAKYVFKLGPKGLGFYRDCPPAVPKTAAAARPGRRGGIMGAPASELAAAALKRSRDSSDEEDAGVASKHATTGLAVSAGQVLGGTKAGDKKKALPGRLRKKLARMKQTTSVLLQ